MLPRVKKPNKSINKNSFRKFRSNAPHCLLSTRRNFSQFSQSNDRPTSPITTCQSYTDLTSQTRSRTLIYGFNTFLSCNDWDLKVCSQHTNRPEASSVHWSRTCQRHDYTSNWLATGNRTASARLVLNTCISLRRGSHWSSRTPV